MKNFGSLNPRNFVGDLYQLMNLENLIMSSIIFDGLLADVGRALILPVQTPGAKGHLFGAGIFQSELPVLGHRILPFSGRSWSPAKNGIVIRARLNPQSRFHFSFIEIITLAIHHVFVGKNTRTRQNQPRPFGTSCCSQPEHRSKLQVIIWWFLPEVAMKQKYKSI
jgi:hypothetical protein